MNKVLQFPIKQIDIIKDVINSSNAMGRIRGEEAWEILNEQIKGLTDNSLLIIDISKANPLDYTFCQNAFGPLLKELQKNTNEIRPILFQMLENHKPCFFRGVLKYLNPDFPRKGSISASISAFIDSGMFTMIIIEKQTEIYYCANLSNIDQDILNYVNEVKLTSGREIIEEKKEFETARIIDSLRSLTDKGFIVHTKNDKDQYHSIYLYIN